VDSDDTIAIKYLITYGKRGESRTKTTTNTSVTLDNLEKNTEYVIRVKAKYVGLKYGPESDPLKVTTNPSGQRLGGSPKLSNVKGNSVPK